MSNVVAILTKGQELGFMLAGIRIVEVSDAATAAEAVEQEINNGDTSLVLMEDDYLEALPHRLRKRVDESADPLVVGIPVIRHWEYVGDQGDRLERIIQRAIGYRVKLGGS